MKHVKTLNTRKLQNTVKKGGCGECQTSCQSACKTSSGARDIAKVLQAKQKGEGCLIGERYVVSWAVGHLVTLAEPEEYRCRRLPCPCCGRKLCPPAPQATLPLCADSPTDRFGCFKGSVPRLGRRAFCFIFCVHKKFTIIPPSPTCRNRTAVL